MDYEKDKTGNFERGYSQSNHRKVTGFGLSQDAKRPIATFGTAASYQAPSLFFLFSGVEKYFFDAKLKVRKQAELAPNKNYFTGRKA